jgi:hypothetical protein
MKIFTINDRNKGRSNRRVAAPEAGGREGMRGPARAGRQNCKPQKRSGESGKCNHRPPWQVEKTGLRKSIEKNQLRKLQTGVLRFKLSPERLVSSEREMKDLAAADHRLRSREVAPEAFLPHHQATLGMIVRRVLFLPATIAGSTMIGQDMCTSYCMRSSSSKAKALECFGQHANP